MIKRLKEVIKMKNRAELYKRFDEIMAGLKPVEPSEGFDFEFRQALKAAADEAADGSRGHLNVPYEFVRRAIESLRHALVPKTPVLVRAFSISAAFIIVGSVLYFAQPAGPVVMASKGIVLAYARGAGPTELMPNRTLRVGDLIKTEYGALVDISVDNRYSVRIKGASSLRVARLTNKIGRGKAIFELENGKALVSIEKGFKPASFIINTKEASATALGTKFAVDVSGKRGPVTKVSVLEGKVRVLGRPESTNITLAKGITVGMGQLTEVGPDRIPQPARRLPEEEWLELEELYQIGKKPQVILLIKYTPDRVMQLLRPCPIYISDERPRQIPQLLEEAVRKIETAIRANKVAEHFEAIRILERILKEHPSDKYDVQLLLYVGAYYEYIGYHREAMASFEDVVKRHPDSPLASLAMAAMGVIYEDKLNDPGRAGEIFRAILKLYPNSLEAIWAEEKLGIKKDSILA